MSKFIHIRMASGRTHESELGEAAEGRSIEELQNEMLLQIGAAGIDSTAPVLRLGSKLLFLRAVESIEFTEDDTVGAIGGGLEANSRG